VAVRITVTKRELEALRRCWALLGPGEGGAREADPDSPDRERAAFGRNLHQLLAKAALAHEPMVAREVGPVLADLEAAFLLTARSKGARLGRLGARDASALVHRAAELRVTVEEAARVGTWVWGQTWLKRGVTLAQVLRNWPDWSGRATADARARTVRTAPAPLEVPGEVPPAVGGAA
jgi:hypothetical protein